MTEIYLIRHGETEWNRLGRTQGGSDIPLNEAGRHQAMETGRALSRLFRYEKGVGAIYSSPLLRAWETAEIISSSSGLDLRKIILEPRIVERHYGSAEGLFISERAAKFGDRNAIPDAEPWESVMERGVAVMHQIRQDHPRERILVVAHGGLINSVLSVLTDGEYTHKSGPLKNAGVTIIAANGKDHWQVILHNQDEVGLEQFFGAEDREREAIALPG